MPRRGANPRSSRGGCRGRALRRALVERRARAARSTTRARRAAPAIEAAARSAGSARPIAWRRCAARSTDVTIACWLLAAPRRPRRGRRPAQARAWSSFSCGRSTRPCGASSTTPVGAWRAPASRAAAGRAARADVARAAERDPGRGARAGQPSAQSAMTVGDERRGVGRCSAQPPWLAARRCSLLSRSPSGLASGAGARVACAILVMNPNKADQGLSLTAPGHAQSRSASAEKGTHRWRCNLAT